MKSLDQRLSSFITAYDELDDMTQEELMAQQHFLYEKDCVIQSIGENNSKIMFDLFLEDVLEKMQDGQKYRSFVNDCLIVLSARYNLDVLLDYINRKELVLSSPDTIMELVKYFAYHKWLDDIALCLPEFDVNVLNNNEAVKNLLTESFLTTKNKILEMSGINPLIHFYFTFCSNEDGLNTLIKLVITDLPGIISVQLVKQMIK